MPKGNVSPQPIGDDCFPASRQPGFSVFRHVVNAKFCGFCPSEASDERKMIKMTFRPWTKCRKQQNLRFAHGRNAKIGKIYVSPTGEIQKTRKTTFRPRTKCRKRQNLCFRHGGKTENGKIYVSATAEAFFSNHFLFFITFRHMCWVRFVALERLCVFAAECLTLIGLMTD